MRKLITLLEILKEDGPEKMQVRDRSQEEAGGRIGVQRGEENPGKEAQN